MTGGVSAQKLGLSGNIFRVANDRNSPGVPTDRFEQQPKGSDYRAEYRAMQLTLPQEYRNNDALIDKALQHYFFGKTPANTGVVQKAQARMQAVDKAITEHKQQFAKIEAPITKSLEAQQAKLASLPGASVMYNPMMRTSLQMAVNTEIAVLNRINPQLATAAQTRLRAGTALAYVAADYVNPLKPKDIAKDTELKSKKPDSRPNLPLSSTAVALDLDKDGKLMCTEIGQWKADTRNHSANSRAYQDYVSGMPGTHFEVSKAPGKAVDFDGCKDRSEGPLLLEAKGDHGNVLDPMGFDNAINKIIKQGESQDKVANEWHVQTEKDHMVIKGVLKDSGFSTPVLHDPYPTVKK